MTLLLVYCCNASNNVLLFVACRKSWFSIDLGVWIIPTAYSMRHARGYGKSALRNWLLQVSKDGLNWTTIHQRDNDVTLSEPGYVLFINMLNGCGFVYIAVCSGQGIGVLLCRNPPFVPHDVFVL